MSKITMKDIAERANVSKTTVSMVINKKDESISEETKKKIKDIIKETGYIPNSIARGLNTHKSETIAIIVPDISNPYFSELSRAVEDVANKLKYNVILCNSDNDSKKEKKYAKLLISKRVDGAILIPGDDSEESAKLLKANGIPFVFVDRNIEGYEENCGVYLKNKRATMMGLEYLYNKGKRRIAFVTGPLKIDVNKRRRDGYEEIMNKYNIYDKSLIYESEFSLEGGIDITNKILDENKDIDSILYCNDVMAIGGMKTLKRRGYNIPSDIAIMGFDGIKLSKMIEPELTTIAQPIYMMGEEACKLIINIIDKKDSNNKSMYFKADIIEGGTV